MTILFSISATVFGQETVKPATETAKPAAALKPVTEVKLAAKLPTVQEVLAKYVQAIGGREANEKIKTRMMKGTLELAPMGIKGSIESYVSAPGKSYSKTTLQGIGDIIEGFDGTTAWTINPLQGNRDKSGEELLQTKLINNFYRETNLEKLYPKMTVTGTDKVGDREVYVVSATPVGLDTETFYFDKQNGLLLRSDGNFVSPEGKTSTKTFYEDFREIDGIKQPFKIRSVLPQFEITTNIMEIKNGVAIEEAKFSKPKM